ncbi:quinoprotein relay system zinc metallohydrolase 1 [Aquisalimonas asiatica]|uniref:Uncharacterized sulfatase n=1 Tax=Aquisalimonas asiatica TaxID=406100 RepID=A0A1H8S6N1_9GAMM|nr:quinoprotein relay system zinc metallohydrolase 1 [Aquisalimonas asiatica]SEO74064.1 uncharacterized sulfatase [Aquisalimonas asiatica]
MSRPWMPLFALVCCIGSANAYDLQPREVADGVWVIEGAREHFTRENQGDIVNTGFLTTGAGVIVIDTGPSLRYGEAMRGAIRDVTAEPVVAVYITHHHPDHFLGNLAFEDVPIIALPHTIDAIERDGDALTDNMYRMVGGAMQGTEPLVPDQEASPDVDRFGDRELEYIAAGGHSGEVAADLVIFDRTSGVLFAGDVVFHDRAPTTPHADLDAWIAELDRLEGVDFRTLVPGHGPVANDARPIRQTRAYLQWLDRHLDEAAEAGLHAAEVMELAIPEAFRSLAVVEAEYKRSVAHLYDARRRNLFEPMEAD